MLREPNEGWHTPPSNEPPRLSIPDEPYVPMNPIRKGVIAVWGIIGVVAIAMASPFLILAGGAAFIWWEVLLWLTRDR